jgi:3-oxoacyl-[acyl-carrier protein] reductase
MRCEGMKVVLCGGASAVGQATMLAMAREGADVACIDAAEPEVLAPIVRELAGIGRRVVVLQGDITDKSAVERLMDEANTGLGRIDVLVNVAGVNAWGPLEDFSESDWDRMMAVNVKGPFLCSVACARYMMKQGKGVIVNIAAASAHRMAAFSGAFGPSKAALVNLTKQMAVEWAKRGIRVNAVSPGPLLTARTAARVEQEKERISKIPLGRVGEVDEIAQTILFLSTDESSYIAGQTIIVDGGGVETWWLYP